jgi:hypothetical protein
VKQPRPTCFVVFVVVVVVDIDDFVVILLVQVDGNLLFLPLRFLLLLLLL